MVTYSYDDAGNNVSRVTSELDSGVVHETWSASYDLAGNLLCESDENDATGSSITHYDYSCFSQ